MNIYERRAKALDAAVSICGESTVEHALIVAQEIENYLAGDPYLQHSPTRASSTDDFWNAQLPEEREQFDPTGKPHRQWSGVAHDLVRTINSSPLTMILKARQIGMTTFLSAYAAEWLKQPNVRVLFLAQGTATVQHLTMTIAGFGAPITGLTILPYNRLLEKLPEVEEQHFDLAIADEFAFMPYQFEQAFVTNLFTDKIMKWVIASTGGQSRGLFHDMWHQPSTGLKFRLTYDTPLYPPFVRKSFAVSGGAIRLDNGDFRPVSDKGIET